MKNKKLIRGFSYLGLVCGISSSLLGNLYFPTAPRADASISPNTSPIAEIVLDDANEISAIRSDMDMEGNQYYVWKKDYYDFDLMTSCNGIYYQVYNKSGLPLTKETEVEKACDPLFNFYSPDITVNENNFLITYVDAETGVYSHVKSVGYYVSNYSVLKNITIIDSGLTLDENARPRIASSPMGDQSGITFLACDNELCSSYSTYFQGFDEFHEKAHLDNTRLDAGGGNQVNANISFSGEHFLVVYEDIFFGEPDAFHSVLAKAINYDASNLSPELLIEADIAYTPDVGGTIDNDYSGTPPYVESHYVTYAKSPAPTPGVFDEIEIKKVYCEYDPGNPGAYYCDTTSRNGEQVFARVSAANNINPKTIPQVTVFKNTDDLKRAYPYENTNIDYLTVGWIEENTLAGNYYYKAQNYTDTLGISGDIITIAEETEVTEPLSISSNRDGHFVATYKSGNNATAVVYPTQFLRIDNEKLVNAPDSNAQENAKVAKNSNGDYVITYQSFNGTDYDIHFALYNKYGDPLKNTTIANSTLSGNQTSPVVSFWNEEPDTPDYGKFIIAWSGNGSGDTDGIFYQIFNQDGSPNGSETLANQNTSSLQDTPDLSTGRFGQFAIVYREETTGQATIILFYKNDTNNIHTSLSATGAEIRAPQVALNPIADGSTGSGGNSKYFATWRENGPGYITSGYLNTSTTITTNSTTNEGALYTEDLDGAYNSANSTFTPPLDPFYYVRTAWTTAEVGSGPKLIIGFYGSAYAEVEDLDTQFNGNNVAIDPATQNIFVIGQKLASYYANGNQVIHFPANAPSSLTTEQIFNSYLQKTATVTEGHGTYAYIEDATNAFNQGDNIGTTSAYEVDSVAACTILEFATDISTHFSISQIVSDPVNGGSGTVVGIGPDHINLENVTGFFDGGGGTLDNAPHNDSYTGVPDASTWDNLHFGPGEGLNFEEGNRISNSDFTTEGEILHVYPDFLNVGMFNWANFLPTEQLLDFNYTDTIVTDPIEYISGNFYRFSVDSGSNTPDWIKAGPTFAVSEHTYYGQTFSSADAAYHTGSTDDLAKFVATSYATSSSPDYLDANGIFQQLVEDPFSTGQKEDLSPATEQQINPGGKYIIVPQTIDFGVVNRNASSTVDLADLNPSCLRITDLDGTDFDLTVSLTDLTHATQPALTISNSNFIIENNDGINPLITSLAAFSTVNDVNLSPSTNPGENANLGTTQTLLSKTNPNTGSWKICPRTQLNIPADANSGTYNGTLTFTLI